MKVKFFLVSAGLLALTGCGSISGFSNAQSDFGCRDAQGKPSCKSISEVYGEGSPVLFSSSESSVVKPVFEPGEAASKNKPKANDFVTLTPAQPWRKPETVLRVWLAPFIDAQGDLHDQRYLYVRLNNGGWETESVEALSAPSRIKSNVRRLTEEKEPSAEEEKRERLKKLPPFGSKTLPLS